MFENNRIDVNVIRPNANFWGIYAANEGADSFDVTIRDNVMNFTGDSANQDFMYCAGDFGSSNTVRDNVVTGIDVTNAIRIEGQQDFVNVNNTDGSGNPLTVE